MTEAICGNAIWRYGVPMICDLRPGHLGPHVDTHEGGGEW